MMVKWSFDRVKPRLKLVVVTIVGIGLVLAGVMLGRITEKADDRPANLDKEEMINGNTAITEEGGDEGKIGEVLGSQLYPVVKVVDGDTVDVEVKGQAERIRLIGIDAPEVHNPDKPVECYGEEVTTEAQKLLKGKRVRLEADPSQDDKDKYDRWLRYVWLEEGENFNLLMVKEGYAREYTYEKAYKYQAEFKEAEQEAKTGGRGLWGEVCEGGEKLLITVTPGVGISPTSASGGDSGQVNLKPTAGESGSSANNSGNGDFTCDCGKGCGAISSCEEAYFQLNDCGCYARDGDKDGVPCESLCSGR